MTLSDEMVKLTNLYTLTTQSIDPHFDVVVGRAWSNDADSCTGGSVVIGGVFSDRQVKGDDPDVKGYPGPSGWVGRRAETQINTKIYSI